MIRRFLAWLGEVMDRAQDVWGDEEEEGPTMDNIGDGQREIEFEPITEPRLHRSGVSPVRFLARRMDG